MGKRTSHSSNDHKKLLTLVLDLDECLIHSVRGENGLCFLSRPYLNTFLEEVSKFYEVGIFTSSSQDYAEPIMDLLGKEFFSFGLYRQHCTQGENKVKDLSKLGRDLKDLVFIDNSKENFALQPSNSFLIKTWEGDLYDFQLNGLLKILLYIKEKYEESKEFDVKLIIEEIKSKVDYNTVIKKKDPYSLYFDSDLNK